ncbi:MAG TPA: DNA polymerase IV [Actinobacteria bacterium]|nr:DNA polymerase IV [Actinomycetota bacterium]
MSRSQVRRPQGLGNFGDDDTGTTILHVDMDAFYASVELLNYPELAGTPVVVGASTGNRGVVLSATYEARALGIHSAMPISRARRLAPQATFIPPHHDQYAQASREVMDIFGSITPIVEPLSLDEAFLDVAGAIRRLGRPVAIATLIRTRVRDEVGITCSVGVASSKFVAKLASTHSKPDGLLLIPHAKVIEFLHPLPVGALWGVGERTEEQLVRLGLETVGDIAETPVATLERALGTAQGRHLHDLSWGTDPRAVIPNEPEKSIGNEETFDSDTDDHEWIRSRIAGLSDQVARRLRASQSVARTVGLKVRFADFTTITRSRTLDVSTDVGADIYATAWSLFSALGLQRARIRLVGVRVEGLTPTDETPTQLALDTPDRGHRDAEVAMDRLRQRYGPGAIRPGRVH